MATHQRKTPVVTAVQFDAAVTPLPPGVVSRVHPVLGPVFIYTPLKVRINDTDWILRNEFGQAQVLTNARFTAIYEPIP